VNRIVRSTTIAIALVLGLAACGGGSSRSADPAAPAAKTSTPSGATPAGASDPSEDASGSGCSLATVDEITAAAGRAMSMSGGAGGICVFSAVADASFTIYAQVYTDQPSQASMTQLENSGSEHLDGMGDDAFWNAVAGTVYVRSGGRAFSFTLPSLANLTTSPDATKAKMVTLAQAALSRFTGGS
jgi:hypothetical protein